MIQQFHSLKLSQRVANLCSHKNLDMNAHCTFICNSHKVKISRYHTMGGGITTPLNREIPNFKISLRIKHTFSYKGIKIDEW